MESGLLEKEITAFATEESKVRASGLGFSHLAVASVEHSETDKLLENTLLNIKLDKPLTKRESQILKLIVTGETNKGIAQKIHRTERTVEYHRHRLKLKLGAKTAIDLVKRAIGMGIV